MNLWTQPVFPPASTAFNRLCLCAAFAITLVWGWLYIGWANPGLVDEPGQLEVLRHFDQNRPGYPATLPNLPGYHFLVLLVGGHGPTLQSARLVTLGCALLGLGAFAGAWRQLHGAHPGGPTLLFALLPLAQPFTAMVYTDIPALAFLLLAVWAHLAGWRVWAAAMLAVACLIRQTCLVWAPLFFLLEALPLLSARRSESSRRSARDWFTLAGQLVERGRWWLLLLAIGAVSVLYAGRFTVGSAHGNQFQFNIATLHFGALLVAVFGLPYWWTQARALTSAWRTHLQTHRTRTLGLTFVLAGLVVLLARTYANPHVWNRELFWLEPPSTFILLRNWPLVWIEQVPLLRWLSAFTVVGSLIGTAWLFSGQPHRRELWLLAPFSAALLFSNGLVDPRYFIQPCALALLWLRPSPTGLLRQIRWFALLCLLIAPWTLDGLALW